MGTYFSQIGHKTAVLERWYRDVFKQNPRRVALATFLIAFLVTSLVWMIVAGYSAYMVRAKANDLTALVENSDDLDLSSEHMGSLRQDVDSLNSNVNRLERLTRIPLWEHHAARVPVVGPRFEAARLTLELGVAIGDAASRAAGIGEDAYAAFETTGISYDPDDSRDTWLLAIDRHRDSIPQISASVENASEIRGQIDVSQLPELVGRRMDTVDRFLERSDELVKLADNYDQFFRAAGGNGTIRYLFLFQNPAELRPAGGFPGTFGVFEFHAGQLVDYEMWDSHDVTVDYIENRSEKRAQPWPFETYAPQDGFLLHDATWYSDFPYTAALMLEMYDETTWPEVNGIVAVQPEAVSDMVHVTGKVEVEVDGEIREINEDNVYDEVERYRWLRFEGLREGVLGDHKDILIDIGEAIMEEFKASGGGDMIEAARLLADSATRRDLQIYIDEPGVQAFLDRRGWSGRLEPDPDTPTLAITYTNFVLEKASMAMNPYYDLYLVRDDDGSFRAKMHMTLEHTGLHDQDPRYYGFQRWWIEVKLPDGAEWDSASHEQMPDPEAHSGGSYTVDLFPEETKDIWISFDLPEIDELMLRRQPGQVPPDVHVHLDGCDPVWGGYLVRDLYIELDSDCPSIPGIEEERPDQLQLS